MKKIGRKGQVIIIELYIGTFDTSSFQIDVFITFVIWKYILYIKLIATNLFRVATVHCYLNIKRIEEFLTTS